MRDPDRYENDPAYRKGYDQGTKLAPWIVGVGVIAVFALGFFVLGPLLVR